MPESISDPKGYNTGIETMEVYVDVVDVQGREIFGSNNKESTKVVVLSTSISGVQMDAKDTSRADLPSLPGLYHGAEKGGPYGDESLLLGC
ncbi:hypothetical protein A1O1_05680 [Capronia coronata CBS 617.96]|uniref:Uncharacterized protein n=1 Tax=Capronia coronata CBS 617.96 TaxID=1182541 RepID=W9Y885_9EURO|nr:uncharacterized protein A1O1_05680 [Capronia coronata CBS 617.96]EXJ88748.1 hypothetical protein A1O1_05680 [Capronia coronata CBS 617.96]